MNILEFVMRGGVAKTAAGHFVTISNIDVNSEYPISGEVLWTNGHISPFQWNSDGYPPDQKTNHCLNLIPTIPITEYKSVSPKLLPEYDDLDTFYKEQTKIISPIYNSDLKLETSEGC